MIVVGSSVWIAQLRGIDNAARSKLRALVESGDNQFFVGDRIMLV